jgi:hypothetical protein
MDTIGPLQEATHIRKTNKNAVPGTVPGSLHRIPATSSQGHLGSWSLTTQTVYIQDSTIRMSHTKYFKKNVMSLSLFLIDFSKKFCSIFIS